MRGYELVNGRMEPRASGYRFQFSQCPYHRCLWHFSWLPLAQPHSASRKHTRHRNVWLSERQRQDLELGEHVSLTHRLSELVCLCGRCWKDSPSTRKHGGNKGESRSLPTGGGTVGLAKSKIKTRWDNREGVHLRALTFMVQTWAT